jgi:hypothetical protein
MVSALSATIAVRDTRAARADDARDRSRREAEERLDRLADVIVAVGEAAIMRREKQGQGAEFAAAVASRLRLCGMGSAKSPLIAEFRLIRTMERTGIEPVTSGLQSRRSPS